MSKKENSLLNFNFDQSNNLLINQLGYLKATYF